MDIPSKKLEQAVFEISKLPGIGQKTALRLALHLLRQDTSEVLKLSEALLHMKTDLKQCERCFNISDSEICEICRKPKRDEQTICVVEDIRDVMAIENAHGFTGLYHVLGGLISPMDGIGPSNLTIDALLKRIEEDEVKEVILALNTTMEGDTTNFYIYRKLNPFAVTISTLARGVAIGDDLEYADEVTLGRSILNRTSFEDTFKNSKHGT